MILNDISGYRPLEYQNPPAVNDKRQGVPAVVVVLLTMTL